MSVLILATFNFPVRLRNRRQSGYVCGPTLLMPYQRPVVLMVAYLGGFVFLEKVTHSTEPPLKFKHGLQPKTNYLSGIKA